MGGGGGGMLQQMAVIGGGIALVSVQLATLVMLQGALATCVQDQARMQCNGRCGINATSQTDLLLGGTWTVDSGTASLW